MRKINFKGIRITLLLAILLFNFRFDISTVYAAPPANQNFSAATLISSASLPYSASLDTTEATTEGEAGEVGINSPCNSDFPEDNHTLYLGHKTVWYRFIPSSSGPLSIDTFGSNYDTYIAVWVGSALNNLTLAACGDDNLDGQTSQVLFIATSGVTYYIQVAQYNGHYVNGVRTTATGGLLNLHVSLVPGVGKYDDTHSNWAYTGAWTHFTGAFPFYNNTDSFTNTPGGRASFTFYGTQFILTYTKNTVRGNMEIYVDSIKVATINANGPQTFQVLYTSAVFLNGTHVVQVRNVGGGGGYIDVDAIEILNTPPPGAGKYDNTHSNWVYSGAWTHFVGAFPFYNNTDSYSGVTGNVASFTFTGTQFILTYTRNSVRGNMQIYVDGIKVATINANGAQTFQVDYVSAVFLNGTHVVKILNAGGGGGYIDVDAIQILNTAAPGVGKYDNTDFNWVYNGSWAHFAGAHPFHNNTDSYSGITGETASFTFTGTQFILTYTMNTVRGKMEIYVDGGLVTTLNAKGLQTFEVLYVSPTLSNGTHVVQVRNGGGGVGYIDVDAIEILNTSAPGTGKYDDTDSNWVFNGTWTHFTGAFPFYNNTDSFTNTPGGTASFRFTGTQFILSYTKNSTRGNMEIYVDGIKVATINANGPQTYEVPYTSAVFPSGTHVVKMRNAGGGGGYVDVDAIEVLSTAAPGAGNYDDTDSNWAYNGSWTHFVGAYPFLNNTDSYSGVTGETASFTFTGTEFILFYTRNTVRGNMEIYVDGVKLATINANGPQAYQATYLSPIFLSGTHVVQLQNGGGGYVDVDALQILNTAAPGVGKYDNTHFNWAYNGSWTHFAGAFPFYQNTDSYSGVTGETASFTFTGTVFVLTYTVNSVRGYMEIYVDGTRLTTLNANGPQTYQVIYISPTLSSGTHVLQIRNRGGIGGYIDVDAVQIN